MREKQLARIGLRATTSEVRMLEKLAEARGMSMSDVVRQLVRTEWERLAAERRKKLEANHR